MSKGKDDKPSTECPKPSVSSSPKSSAKKSLKSFPNAEKFSLKHNLKPLGSGSKTDFITKFLNFDSIKNLFGKSSGGQAPGMGDSAKSVGRPMKYPYTFTAKIAQFPVKHYINNAWIFKYYLIAVVVTAPLFYKISRMSNTPENIRRWDEIRRREFTPGGHH